MGVAPYEQSAGQDSAEAEQMATEVMKETETETEAESNVGPADKDVEKNAPVEGQGNSVTAQNMAQLSKENQEKMQKMDSGNLLPKESVDAWNWDDY